MQTGIVWVDDLVHAGNLNRDSLLSGIEQRGGLVRSTFSFLAMPSAHLLVVDLAHGSVFTRRTNLLVPSPERPSPEQARSPGWFLPEKLLSREPRPNLTLIAVEEHGPALMVSPKAHLWTYDANTASLSWDEPLSLADQLRVGTVPPVGPMAIMPLELRSILLKEGPSVGLAVQLYESWFGQLPAMTSVPSVVEPTSSRLAKPPVVEEWHRAFARIEFHHRFSGACQPAEWDEDEDGEHVILQAEEQYVERWGIRRGDLAVVDPPVFSSVDNEEWQPFAATTTQYAVLFVLCWMISGGGAGTHGVLREPAPESMDGLLPLGLSSIPLFNMDLTISGDEDAWVLLGDETHVLAPNDAAFDRFLTRQGLNRDNLWVEYYS